MSSLLNVIGIKKNNILKGISFNVTQGEMIAVMGPSGSGKSTLLYNVSGMDQADGGEAWLGDTEIVALSEDEKAKMRLTRMGFVFQHMNMLSNLNIIDNITFPAVRADKKHTKQHYDRARKLLDDFHNDFDSAIEKCIASDQTDVLFTTSLSSKINRLYDKKWKSAITKFDDICLQSYILSTIATLREYCKSLDPDSEPAAASVRKLKIKLRDNYVKTHPDSFAGLFPYDAFIDDWDDEG